MTFPTPARDGRRRAGRVLSTPPLEGAVIQAVPGAAALVHESAGRPAAHDPEVARILETVAEQLCVTVTLHLGDEPGARAGQRTQPVTDGERSLGVLAVDERADQEEALALAARLLGQRLGRLGERSNASGLTHDRIASVLEPGRLGAHFQPIVSLPGGHVVGVEALARFPTESAAGSSPSPARWLRAASAAGLRTPLEVRAAAVGLEGLAALPSDWFLSLNLSAPVLASGAVTPLLHEVPVERVIVELTEHDAVEDYAQLNAVLAPLRAKGLRLAVDDVGAGFASMRHVLRMRPDVLKLDRGLMRDLTADTAAASLVAVLRDFAAGLGSSTVVEGVERDEDERAVRHLGVELAQGYRFGAPQPLSGLLRRGAGRRHSSAVSASRPA